MSASVASKKQVRSWFKPGVGGNPAGKAKGTPNKLTRDVKEMILTALSDVGGAKYLARQAEQNPVAFMGLVGKVLPLQLAGHDGGALIVDFRWADNTNVSTVTIEHDAVDTSVDTASTAVDTEHEAVDVEWKEAE